MNHIVVVTTSFPDPNHQPGGDLAGAFAADFAAQLANHVEVTVLAPSGSDSSEESGSLTIKRFKVPSLPLSLLKPLKPSHWPNIFYTLRAGKRALGQVAKEIPIDHVFAMWSLPSGFWARSLWRGMGIPYSTWALGSDIWVLGKVPAVRLVLKTVLSDASARFADGYILKQDVEKICRKECFFLPSSRKLPPAKQKIKSSAPPYKLAFLGRWHPHKGIDLFLKSLELLTEKDWRRIAEIRICGGGPLEELVIRRTDNLRKAGRPVSMGSYLSRQEAADLYHWAHYLVLPSRIESIPVIFSDCMQAGLPLISTPTGDLPRLMTDFSVGVLADSITSMALARAITQALYSSPGAFSSGLEQALRQFDISKAVKFFLDTISNRNEQSSLAR